MATLNSSYQYIGRSNAVNCPSGWKYYTLIYAKTTGDISTGRHSVTIKMRMACNVDSSFYGWSTTGFAKADGVSAFSWSGQQVPNSAWNSTSFTEGGYTYSRWIDLKEGTAVVNTGLGVAKEITINTSWVMNEAYSKGWFPNKGEYATTSIKVTLPMLAGASTITATVPVTLGSNCSISWVPQAASFRYKLKFAIGTWIGWSDIIHPNKTSSHTYNGYIFPMEVANHVKKKTGTMTATLYTYSDSGATSQIGSADSETFTVTVPDIDDTRPALGISLSPISNLSAPFDSMYIQGKSKVQATLEWTLQYGADAEDSNITVDGTVYGYPYESDYLTKDGEISVKGSVKDSRGHYGTAYEDITVIPYSKPLLQAASGNGNIVVARCDSNGNIKDDGTYLKIKAKVGYEKIIANDVQYNFGKIQYRYRIEGGVWSAWYTILDTASATSNEVSTGALLNGALSIQSNYQVQVKAVDNIDESLPFTQSIPSDEVYMHRPAGGKGMGLGGYSKGTGALEVYWPTHARGGLVLFNAEGDELSANEIFPLPRGELGEGWNPNYIANGVHVVNAYPLKDAMGNTIMENGILIQMYATARGSMKIQLAFPSDNNAPAYRIFQEDNWTPWYAWNIFMI